MASTRADFWHTQGGQSRLRAPKIKSYLTDLGGVYRTGRLSPRSEFTPVPSHGSIFVYMIPPQNVMPARLTPA